jgi:hypothetical protein
MLYYLYFFVILEASFLYYGTLSMNIGARKLVKLKKERKKENS